MAQVVAQRQVVTTKTQLTQKQSTEMVQVMLYTSASMLCRLRGIFPLLAFDEVDFDDDDEFYTFEGLMSGEHPCRAEPPSPSNTSLRQSEREPLTVPLLKRGRSVRADQFLDSLDTAFEALHRGTLYALRIPFMSDPEANSNSLELWSFRILYKPSNEGERLVQGLATQLGNDDVYDPSLCVVDLLGQIYDQCGELPQLPDDRYIQPSILYREDGWEPKGFMETQSQPSVQGFAGWHPHTADLGIIGGVHHDLALRIASLKHEHSNTRRISQDLRFRKAEIVRGGRLSARTSTLSSGNSSIQPRTISPAPSRRNFAASAIPETPQRNDQFDKNEATSADSRALTEVAGNLVLDRDALSANDESQNPATTPDISKQLPHSDVSSASQVDDDMRRRNSLDNMMMPSSYREDNVVTQVRRSATQSLDDQDIPSPEVTEHMKNYDFLTSETAHHLWDVTCGLQKKSTQTLVNAPITSCRCQLHDLTEEMTRCSICGVQQHSICQGYLEGDSRQSPRHVCHLCLLGRTVDKAILKRLCELALERRAMDLLLSEEVDNAVELSRKLNMQFDKVAELVTSLVSQGFIVEQGKRSTRNSQGKITFPDVVSTTEYVDSLARFFDPYQVVSHHFSDLTLSNYSASDVAQALRARYPILAIPPRRTTPNVLPELKRAKIVDASRSTTGSAKQSATKKRKGTVQVEEGEMSEQATPVRRSSRVRTPTPKMKEAKFGFFINGQNLPSREHPVIKSKRFKGDS